MSRISTYIFVLLASVAYVSPAAAQGSVSKAKPCGDETAKDDASLMPCRIEASIFTAPESPSVFSDLKVRSTDLLEASLSVENKGGSLAYAPFLYGLANYRPIVSELRLRLSQKDNQTTFGFGSQYNPLSPRSGRGKREWLALGGTKPPLETLRIRLDGQRQPLEKELAELREKYRVASTLPANPTKEQLEALEAEQKVLAKQILKTQAKLAPVTTEMAALDAAEKKVTSDRVQKFYTALLDTRMPIVSAGYNATTFALLGGSSADADNDGLNDNEHRLKKHSLSASVDLRLATRFQIGGLVSREWDRGSAEDGTTFAHTAGFSFTAGGIVAILDSQYEQSAAYRESLFIPSVVLGGAIEYRKCGNASSPGVVCPDKLERLTALTPFVDLKVTKTTQFRIGAPIRFSKPVTGKSGTDVGVVTAFTLQLGEPK